MRGVHLTCPSRRDIRWTVQSPLGRFEGSVREKGQACTWLILELRIAVNFPDGNDTSDEYWESV